MIGSAELVATGTWLYDRTVKMPVYVVKLDYDFWYELGVAENDLGPDEVPDLNSDGHLFYVMFRELGSSRVWPDSQGFKTMDAAKEAAKTKVPGDIAW